MTTPTPDPLESIALPYSVTLTPLVGTYGFTSWGSLTLPIGVNLIRFTWDGPEAFRYRIGRDVNGTTVYGAWVYVIQAASIGTPRSSPPIEIAVSGTTRIACQIGTSFPQSTLDAGCTAGITVIPISRG